MPAPLHFRAPGLRRLLALSLLATACALFADAPPGQAAAEVPADNPYRPALDAMATSPKTGTADGSPASPDPAALAILTRALRAGATTPQVDWGVDYESPPWEITFPHIAPARGLVRAALAEADRLAASDPLAAANLVVDAIALGRHLGDDALIGQLVRINIEGKGADWLAGRLPGFDAATADAIGARLATLPGRLSWRATLQMEQGLMDGVLLELFRIVARHPAADRERSARTLRMAGMLAESGSVSISLETPDGSFWLQPRQSLHGVTLLSVDMELHQALLTYQGRMVRLQLQDRTVTDLDEGGVRAALAALPATHALRQFFDSQSGSESPGVPDRLREWNETAIEIGAYHEALLAVVEAPPGSAPALPDPRSLGPLAKIMVAPLPDIPVLAITDRVRDAQLAAAVSAAGTGQPPAAALDPSTGKPFRVIPTPGGYILESATLDRKGRPIRLTVGAPPPETGTK